MHPQQLSVIAIELVSTSSLTKFFNDQMSECPLLRVPLLAVPASRLQIQEKIKTP